MLFLEFDYVARTDVKAIPKDLGMVTSPLPETTLSIPRVWQGSLLASAKLERSVAPINGHEHAVLRSQGDPGL